MLELTRTLCGLSGVSSREEDVRSYLANALRPHVTHMETDAMGNLIAFKAGRKRTGSKLLLDVHMDEVGIMVSGYTADGCLRFSFVGGVDRRVVIGKKVRIGDKKVPGVVGLKAYHLVTAEEEKTVPKLDDMYIDIGAKDREAAEALVVLRADTSEQMWAGVLDARAALPDTAVVVLCPQEDAFTPPGAGMRGVAFATPDTLAQVVQAQLTVQE